jgi:3-oxoacyl-[acyl-carrier-protein] synthase-1
MASACTAWLGTPGIVCALGRGIDAVGAAALSGVSAGMQAQAGWVPDRRIVVGAVQTALPALPAGMPSHYDSRNNRLLLDAVLQIEPALRATVARYGNTRVGIVLGTSTSGVNENAAAFHTLAQNGAWPPEFDYRRQALAAPSAFLADWLGLAGPAYTLSTACTSSARALLSAKRLLAMDVCDAVVCGGVDTLCRLTINGFAALEALATARCNPFSAHRDGINIGEGAAVFIMQRDRPAGRAVALLGGGASSDAWHMSAPDPTGAGAAQAMRAALADAGMRPADIGWLNLHGTATQHNDAMESKAVAAVFPEGVACTSTKPLTGHTLAAAGAIEAALCWAVLDETGLAGRLPPQCWDGVADTTLPPLDLTTAGRSLPSDRPRVAMSNSFAFGGSNASLILGALP